MTDRTWQAFAVRSGPVLLNIQADRRSAQMYATRPDDRVVPVVLTEDPDGDHLGFVYAGEDHVSLVQREKIFEIQFPYGSAVEVEKGRGEVVRLRAELANPDNDEWVDLDALDPGLDMREDSGRVD